MSMVKNTQTLYEAHHYLAQLSHAKVPKSTSTSPSVRACHKSVSLHCHCFVAGTPQIQESRWSKNKCRGKKRLQLSLRHPEVFWPWTGFLHYPLCAYSLWSVKGISNQFEAHYEYKNSLSLRAGDIFSLFLLYMCHKPIKITIPRRCDSGIHPHKK